MWNDMHVKLLFEFQMIKKNARYSDRNGFDKFLDLNFGRCISDAWFNTQQGIVPCLYAIINEGFLEISEKLCIVRTSFVIDLMALTSLPESLLVMWNEWSSSFTAFHISDNLIRVFIWFTDNMLNLVRRDEVLILSLILDPFNSLSILFWDNWRSFRSLGVGSDSIHLILTHSCNP